jgi:hypothetical protein
MAFWQTHTHAPHLFPSKIPTVGITYHTTSASGNIMLFNIYERS